MLKINPNVENQPKEKGKKRSVNLPKGDALPAVLRETASTQDVCTPGSQEVES
ncbi:MAG: hypothetical protein ACTSV0_00870 [Candidatus Freyarchaeota archaeon]